MKKSCFMLFAGGGTCRGCVVSKRCKALSVTTGYELINQAINVLLDDLPQKGLYKDVDRVSEMVDQILNPSSVIDDVEPLGDVDSNDAILDLI